MIDLTLDMIEEPDGAFIPVIPLGLGFILPGLAFGAGLLGYIAVGRRAGGLRD